jgi:opine dehydrogenase
MIRNIAVLGAGHGGCAAAADLGLRGLSVRLHARNGERLEPLRKQGGIRITGIQDALVPIDMITTSLADAVRDASLIMLVVPSVAHEFYARGLAPLLQEDQTVFLNPGHTGGGLNFVHELRQAGCSAQVKT